MKFLDLFKSRKSRANLSHLRNLICIGNADGHLDKDELHLISVVCARDNLSKSDIERAVNEPQSIDLVFPETKKEKFVHLKDLVALMMCDGDINENELKICKLIAMVYGFNPVIIDEITKHILIDYAIKVNEELANVMENQLKILNHNI